MSENLDKEAESLTDYLEEYKKDEELEALYGLAPALGELGVGEDGFPKPIITGEKAKKFKIVEQALKDKDKLEGKFEELTKEFNEVSKYRALVSVFWQCIESVEYDEKNQELIIFWDLSRSDTRQSIIYLDKKDADKLLEVFLLMEQENDVQQDEE